MFEIEGFNTYLIIVLLRENKNETWSKQSKSRQETQPVQGKPETSEKRAMP